MVLAVTFLASDCNPTFELFEAWLKWIPGGFMGAETKPASLSLIPLDRRTCFGDCTTQLSSTLNFEGRKPLIQHFQRETPSPPTCDWQSLPKARCRPPSAPAQVAFHRFSSSHEY